MNMKRLFLVILPALICGLVFTSCSDTAAHDDIVVKLEGTTWEATVNGAHYTLHFQDSENCSIGTSRTDGSLSLNVVGYSWSYDASGFCTSGKFYLYFDEHHYELGKLACAGSIEKGKIHLQFYDEEGAMYRSMRFKRKI